MFFVFLFFYLALLSRILTIHRTAGEAGGYLLISFLPLPPVLQTLRHQLVYCCRELTSTHSWQPGSNKKPVVHALQNSLFLCLHYFPPGRKMLITRVTMENISCLLFFLTKRLVFVTFKDPSSLSMFTQLTIIFSLEFTNYGCFSP